MPDDNPIGKRLHVERLVARGMAWAGPDPTQVHLDGARDLVGRVIAMHTEPMSRMRGLVALSVVLVGLAAGLTIGFGIGVALAVWV